MIQVAKHLGAHVATTASTRDVDKVRALGADEVLKPGGLAISVVGPPDPHFAAQLGQPFLKPVMALMSRKVRGRAKKLDVRYSFLFKKASGARLKALAALYDNGTLRPVLDRTFGFAETLDAMAYVEQGKANGKIVITR